MKFMLAMVENILRWLNENKDQLQDIDILGGNPRNITETENSNCSEGSFLDTDSIGSASDEIIEKNGMECPYKG